MQYSKIFAIMLTLINLCVATDIEYQFTATVGENGTLASSMTLDGITSLAYGTGKQTEIICAAATSGNTSVDWTYNLAGGGKFNPSNFASYRVRNDQATYRASSWGTGQLNAHVQGITSGDKAIGVEGEWKGAFGSVTESYHTAKGVDPKADRYVNLANWNGEFNMHSRLILDPEYVLPNSTEDWLPACSTGVNQATGMSETAASPKAVKIGSEDNPFLAAQTFPLRI